MAEKSFPFQFSEEYNNIYGYDDFKKYLVSIFSYGVFSDSILVKSVVHSPPNGYIVTMSAGSGILNGIYFEMEESVIHTYSDTPRIAIRYTEDFRFEYVDLNDGIPTSYMSIVTINTITDWAYKYNPVGVKSQINNKVPVLETFEYTYIIKDQNDFNDWLSNKPGNDYTHVFINKGIYDLRERVYIDWTNKISGTGSIMLYSKIVFINYVDISGVSFYSGTSSRYYINFLNGATVSNATLSSVAVFNYDTSVFSNPDTNNDRIVIKNCMLMISTFYGADIHTSECAGWTDLYKCTVRSSLLSSARLYKSKIINCHATLITRSNTWGVDYTSKTICCDSTQIQYTEAVNCVTHYYMFGCSAMLFNDYSDGSGCELYPSIGYGSAVKIPTSSEINTYHPGMSYSYGFNYGYVYAYRY